MFPAASIASPLGPSRFAERAGTPSGPPPATVLIMFCPWPRTVEAQHNVTNRIGRTVRLCIYPPRIETFSLRTGDPRHSALDCASISQITLRARVQARTDVL